MAIGIIRSKKQKRKHRKTKNYKKKTKRGFKNREQFVNTNTKFTEENSHYVVSNDRVNNDSITKKINKCNKILVDKEKKCNCYVKKNKTIKADKYSNYKHLPECKQKRFKNGCED